MTAAIPKYILNGPLDLKHPKARGQVSAMLFLLGVAFFQGCMQILGY